MMGTDIHHFLGPAQNNGAETCSALGSRCPATHANEACLYDRADPPKTESSQVWWAGVTVPRPFLINRSQKAKVI